MFNKLLILFIFTCSPFIYAEQFINFKDAEVHYSVFNSTFLNAKVTAQYQLRRSEHTAIINISVLDKSKLGKPAVEAKITGQVRNLIGQIRPLTFHQVKEASAIYYLAEFTVDSEDIYSFDIQVNAANTGSGTLRFKQKLYSQ